MACRTGALLVNTDSYWFPRLQIAGDRGVFIDLKGACGVGCRMIIIIMSLLSAVRGAVTWY